MGYDREVEMPYVFSKGDAVKMAQPTLMWLSLTPS